MKILAIDTSSAILSIALAKGADIIKEKNIPAGRSHSALLVPEIKNMLKKARTPIEKVDGFVVGLGPGSFTGLRIGVSTVKGFGIALKKPCVGVASIDALAMNTDGDIQTIAPIIDAKRENVYSAIYSKGTRKSKYLLLKIDELMKKIDGPCVFLGDAVNLYREKILELKKDAIFLDEKFWYPRAGNLIKLALPKIKKHKKDSLAELNPIYLYPKDCQVRKK